MDKFPTSTDYFSKDNGSQGSSATVTPWTPAIPRSVPSLENMPLSDDDPMDTPPPYNYTHLPSEGTEPLLTKSGNSDEVFLTVKKTAGAGKRSRFSEFFRWNPSPASTTKDSDLTDPHGENFKTPAFDHTYSTTVKDAWSMDQLQSAIQPFNPRLANLVPLLERSVWHTSSEEIARHLRTTSEEKAYKKQLAPIGTPLAAKSSTTNQQRSDLFEQIALSEQEIRDILSRNWESPSINPLTGREVTWLMRLHDTNQPISNKAPADISQPATALHSRNVSTDSSRGSLSPEPSSSLIVSASAPASSPATSTSTAAQAQAKAKATQSIRFTNAEAQAQQQREIEIACMKEQRAREAVLRPPPMPMSMPMPMSLVAPASATTPAPMSLLLAAGSRLAPSTATAAPFVPMVAGIGMPPLGEGPAQELGKGEWASLLGRQILELQGALELVTASGSEAGL